MCVSSYERQWSDVGKVLRMGFCIPNSSYAEGFVVME